MHLRRVQRIGCQDSNGGKLKVGKVVQDTASEKATLWAEEQHILMQRKDRKYSKRPNLTNQLLNKLQLRLESYKKWKLGDVTRMAIKVSHGHEGKKSGKLRH